MVVVEELLDSLFLIVDIGVMVNSDLFFALLLLLAIEVFFVIDMGVSNVALVSWEDTTNAVGPADLVHSLHTLLLLVLVSRGTLQEREQGRESHDGFGLLVFIQLVGHITAMIGY